MRHPSPVRPLRAGTILLALLGAAASGAAQELPPGRWQPTDPATSGPAWEELQARFGSGWSVYTDVATGAPAMVLGPPIPLGMTVRADAAGIARARALLEELREVLRVTDPAAFELERAVAAPNPYGQEVVTIAFKQTWRGLELWHQSEGGDREKLAAVKFHFKGTHLVLFGSDAVPDLRLPEALALEEAQAPGRALESLGAAAAAPERVTARSYVSVRGDRAFLAREAAVLTGPPAPHDFRVIFDAHTGERVETRDDLRHVDVTGNVKAGVLEYPQGPFTQEGLYALRATVSQTGNWAYTGYAGSFTIANAGTSPVTVTGAYQGQWASVSDESGNGNVTFSRSATPGTSVSIVLNPSNLAEFETAEASAFHWTTQIRYFVNLFHPGFTGLANLPVRVNLDDSCNAYYSGGRINFFRSNPHPTIPGVTCRNTAYQEIVGHEYGHAFHAWFHGSTNPGGFSEGIGDHLGYVLSHSRVIGRGFRSDGGVVRDYRPGGGANLTQWPCSNCEVHKRGEVWAGCMMDLEENLIASMGGLAGSLHFRYITLPAYAANPGDEAEALAQVYLMDDDDSILFNGTPRCREITAAARRHTLPVPWQLPTSCGNDPLPPLTGEYRTPVAVTELNGSNFDADRSPCLDDSQLNVWFARIQVGGLGGHDIWTASRPSIGAPWSGLASVPGVSSPADDSGVEVSGDGRTMFLSTNRPGGAGGYDIWMSTRAGAMSPWSAPVPIPEINTPSDERHPSLTGDGLELFYSTGGNQGTAIMSATRTSPTGTTWTVRLHRDFLGNERPIAVSHDGLRLHYANDHQLSSLDLYQVFRWSPASTFISPAWRIISEANSTSHEEEGDLTDDGFSFYFSRIIGTTGRSNIYRADRVLPAMLGARSARANSAVVFALRRDPGDFGYIAMGVDPLPPTPIGGVQGSLLILPLVTVAAGVHNEAGLVRWYTPIVYAPGVFVHLQGISQDAAGQWYLSDRLSFLHLP